MTYWEETGRYQKEYDDLLGMRLVPVIGDANTYEGQVLRYMGNLYYDWFNNGLGNDMEEAQIFLRKWAVVFSEDRKVKLAIKNIHTELSKDEDYELMADAVIKWVYEKIGLLEGDFQI